jgi:hypothetical protein
VYVFANPFLTLQDTLDRAREYIQELRQVSPNAIVVLAGNKCDLESQRKVMKRVWWIILSSNLAIGTQIHRGTILIHW